MKKLGVCNKTIGTRAGYKKRQYWPTEVENKKQFPLLINVSLLSTVDSKWEATVKYTICERMSKLWGVHSFYYEMPLWHNHKCFLKFLHTIYFMFFHLPQLLPDPESFFFSVSIQNHRFHYDILIHGCIVNRMQNERKQTQRVNIAWSHFCKPREDTWDPKWQKADRQLLSWRELTGVSKWCGKHFVSWSW